MLDLLNLVDTRKIYVNPTNGCNHILVLKAYLSTVEHTLESKPHGQLKYTFPGGVVLNFYEAAEKTFQGTAPSGDFSQQVAAMVNK